MTLMKTIFSLREQKEQYNYGVDIIKVLAMFLVSLVHTTTLSGWSTFELSWSLKNFWIVFGRMCGFCCVPLYMITTGYLCWKKQLSGFYYFKIIKILLEYFVCAVVFYLFNVIITENVFDIIQMFRFVLSFTNFWYISMYIGMFIFIPFLNILYNNLKNSSQKVLFIGCLLLILSLPGTCFVFSFNYWLAAYPILFYYIGCYFAEYKCNLSKKYLFALLVLNVTISSLVLFMKVPINVETYCSLFCVLSSALIFLMLIDLFIEKKNVLIRLIRRMANLTLSYYLLGG